MKDRSRGSFHPIPGNCGKKNREGQRHMKKTLTAISIILLVIAIPMGIFTVAMTRAPVYTGSPMSEDPNVIESIYPEDARRELGGIIGAVLYAFSIPTAILGLCRYKKARRVISAVMGILILLLLCLCGFLMGAAFFLTLLPLAVCMLLYTVAIFIQLSRNRA